MVVRIRLRRGRPIQRQRGTNRHLASAVAALLGPAALMAYVLGFWRLASDMGLAGHFGIRGLFSHWQIWVCGGLLMQTAAYALNRYGRMGSFEVPRILIFRTFSPPRQASELVIRPRRTGTR